MVKTDEKEVESSNPETATPTPTGTENKEKEAGTKSETITAPTTTTKDSAKTKKGGVGGGGGGDGDKGTADTGSKSKVVPEKKVTDSDPAVVPVTPAVPEVEKKMRAVVLHSFGGLRNVKMGERPLPPPPNEGQVTIQVKISGLNFQDLLLRLGILDAGSPPIKAPLILGTELIGVVTAVGENVTKVKVDDLVFGLPEGGGAWTEFVNLDERLIFRVTQPGISLPVLGSTFPYLVAQILLSRVAGLEEGANILVHSAGGGVGLALKELASLRGVNVLGIAGPGKHEALGGHGFKALFKRGQQDYVAEVKKLCPEGLDAVFDAQGGDDCSRGISLLAPWGTYVLFGSANIVTGENRGFLSLAKSWWSQVEKVSPMKLYEENKSIAGLHLRHMLRTCPARVEKALAVVWDLMAQGKIHPMQDMTFHYETVVQGMQRMHERKNVGKILIVPEVQVVCAEEATPGGEASASASAAAATAPGVTNGEKEGEAAAK